MSLSRFLGVYYKLPKSDPNAVYLLPNAVYLLQCCFIAANIVWAGQCDNSLFPWKLYKINWTALWSRNKHGCKGWEFLFQKKTSLGTGFIACNCLFDSRNCLLTSLILGSYYKLNWPKRASAVYWLLGTLLYPCQQGLPQELLCETHDPTLSSPHVSPEYDVF